MNQNQIDEQNDRLGFLAGQDKVELRLLDACPDSVAARMAFQEWQGFHHSLVRHRGEWSDRMMDQERELMRNLLVAYKHGNNP
jgi:hypothetical protein